jgi:SpoU rRNA methylase family enzyme
MRTAHEARNMTEPTDHLGEEVVVLVTYGDEVKWRASEMEIRETKRYVSTVGKENGEVGVVMQVSGEGM